MWDILDRLRKPNIPIDRRRIHFYSPDTKPQFKFSDLLGFIELFKPRPDLSKEPVELVEIYQPEGEWEMERYFYVPIFSNISPIRSSIACWFRNIPEYHDFAWLEFCRKYTAHQFSKNFRKAYHINKQNVKDYISGKKNFHVYILRGGSQIISADRS